MEIRSNDEEGLVLFHDDLFSPLEEEMMSEDIFFAVMVAQHHPADDDSEETKTRESSPALKRKGQRQQDGERSDGDSDPEWASSNSKRLRRYRKGTSHIDWEGHADSKQFHEDCHRTLRKLAQQKLTRKIIPGGICYQLYTRNAKICERMGITEDLKDRIGNHFRDLEKTGSSIPGSLELTRLYSIATGHAQPTPLERRELTKGCDVQQEA